MRYLLAWLAVTNSGKRCGVLCCVLLCCCPTQIMYGVCRALKLRHNEVHVTSKRVGGGFGGKVRLVWGGEGGSEQAVQTLTLC